MQVQMLHRSPNSTAKLPGPFQVLFSVIRNTGMRGLWHGHTGTLIRETGGNAAWFSTKEFVSSLLVARRTLHHPETLTYRSGVDAGLPNQQPNLLLWESALAGACAGASFNIALFPADTVKSAMQTQQDSAHAGAGSRATFLGTAVAMYKKQGLKGLYAGCGITVARAIPSSAIIFIIYDGLNRRFG
jgi:ornithine carrier protein